MAKKRPSMGGITAIVIVLILIGGGYMGLRYVYPIDFIQEIKSEAAKYDIDPYLVVAMIHTESKFNSEARSNKDARGLMQVTEPTWIWAIGKMGYDLDLFDRYLPQDNLAVGIWYLNYLNKSFSNYDETVILAAYNAGEGNVRKWLEDKSCSYTGKTLDKIPFSETASYVDRVEQARKIYNFLYRNIFD